MIKGFYLNEEFVYNGAIESVGEYDSTKAKGFKVWMGKTEYGFVYACYKKGETPLVLSSSEAVDMLRFYNKDSFTDISFNKTIPVPEECKGLIAANANKLREENRPITCQSKEFAKAIGL